MLPNIGISEVTSIDGLAAIVKVDGQLCCLYEFRLSLEVVIDGIGKVVQFAQLTSEKPDSELNQNEPDLTKETICMIIQCIRKVLNQFAEELIRKE